jgi:phosphoribosyl 1,2-cyclic phosphodiesterase
MNAHADLIEGQHGRHRVCAGYDVLLARVVSKELGGLAMESSMRVTFWGVRGSIPSPGALTARYGGNTSCVAIELGREKTLVLDAGTGIRELGKAMIGRDAEIFVLLSHNHWDHIQGFPFFAPIYQPHRRIYCFPTPQGHTLLYSLLEQMDGPHFPVTPKRLPSQTECITDDVMGFLREHGMNISRIPTNHPGGGYGYRIEHEGRSVVYLTDNELDPPYTKVTEFEAFAHFCQHADLLIHDAQYLPSDMPHKHGWGHSLVSQACELAVAAEVKHLILYHHDPERTDHELDAIQEDARAWFACHEPSITCTVAFEGLVLDLCTELQTTSNFPGSSSFLVRASRLF